MNYIPGFAGAALRHENSASDSRLVYLAFGLEGVAGPQPNSAETLLDNILSWLTETSSVLSEPPNSVPEEFQLKQNYPNPFNPTTTIEYSIPDEANVCLKIYDILGKEIATLVSAKQSQGNYRVQFHALNLPSGIYFYELRAGTFSQTKRFVLIQ